MKENTSAVLDTFDLAILRILQKDNAVPHRVIGEQVNLSAPSVQRRIRRMENSGVIAANVSIVDPTKVELPLTIIVEVELVSETAEGIDTVKKLFSETPQIQQCYYVTGEVDFMLLMVVGSMAEYEELTRSLFFENEIVRKFRTFVSMDRVKAKMELRL
ncbi:Lrp/AsnC family transcriptional regulator [Pelagibius sp. Alg239-R121]|uniref:Lrp/AsnC family transcriptional regulator n=1 Tax=Pelagibius sp. Alg239-R121 TaxID=2993448 RepID=UPI0024A6E704|nr:Lrp/AsnC family transcriptional regulator [Pelagibius sp. Alg239-R121]